MTYKENLEFLYKQLPAFHRIGKAAYKADLSNSTALDNYFGHPHTHYKTIHIAGTNGKGSVSHMIASVLQEAGYKTGLYTSPHLKDFRERIKINGLMISENEVTDFVQRHRKIIEAVKPSFFEMTVALAFDSFSQHMIDVAVVEVGLGGRLDSTNIITPVLSLITNIGHDHMDLLGDTLEKVALEKSGIIKKEVPVVISESQPETKDLFKKKASECNSSIVFADEKFLCRLGKEFSFSGEREFYVSDLNTGIEYKGISPLAGDYQSGNIQALFAAFENLLPHFSLDHKTLLDGIKNTLKNTGLMGRWQILGISPLTICDTGHNREGLEYVLRQLESLNSSCLHFVVGFVNDKDLNSILPLFPQNAKYYFTRASVDRALDEDKLMAVASHFGLEGTSFPNVKAAYENARAKATTSEVIFIGGSTFVVAEAL